MMVRVAGVTMDGRASVIRQLVGEGREKRFVQYEIVAEPENPHDANALAVKCTLNGEKVGFLPREIAGERRDVIGALGRLELGVWRGGVYARVLLPEAPAPAPAPVLLDDMPVEFVETDQVASDDEHF